MTLRREEIKRRLKEEGGSAVASMLVRLRLQTLDRLFELSEEHASYGSVDDRILALLDHAKRRKAEADQWKAQYEKAWALVPEELRDPWRRPSSESKLPRHPRS